MRSSVHNHTTVYVHPSAEDGIATKINQSQLIFGEQEKGDISESELTDHGT
jgi:hypothetical protein